MTGYAPERLSRDDLRAVALLHASNLPGSFLATLSPGFLAEMYRAIEATPRAALFVERNETGRIVGFISGSAGMGAIYRRMLARFHVLPFQLAPTLFQPRKIARIVEILRYSAKASKGAERSPPHAELLSIAVDPSARGTGASARLYERLCHHFARLGEPSFRIVVGAALEPAHRFYRRMGAAAAGEIEVHKGETSILYIQRIGEAGPAPNPAG